MCLGANARDAVLEEIIGYLHHARRVLENADLWRLFHLAGRIE